MMLKPISSKPTPLIILSLSDWEIKATGLLIKITFTPELRVTPGKIRIKEVINNPKTKYGVIWTADSLCLEKIDTNKPRDKPNKARRKNKKIIVMGDKA